MKCLVVGSGGREHALAWKLARSPLVARVYATPGNPGTASVAHNVPLAETDTAGLLDFARGQGIDLTVVGPEVPLAGGLADCFRRAGRPVFGPGAASARLESSKVFAKDFMNRHGIPTAFYRVAASRAEAEDVLRAWGEKPLVIKVDGLAAGKGVFVCDRRAEAEAALVEIFGRRCFGASGARVVLEEKLVGREVSLLVVGDGHGYRRLLPARDHKKVGEGDTGPNTGGMGAVAPAPLFDARAGRTVDRLIVRPVFDALASEGLAYPGILYFGLMMTGAGPRVLEFNVRFGDPETQAVLPLLKSDLAELLFSAARGCLPKEAPVFRRGSAACVVIASRGYPGDYRRGLPITGLAAAEKLGLLVFHAGTRLSDGVVCTAGGRVLGVTAHGETLEAALGRIYAGIGVLEFEGAFYRRDIGTG